MARIEVERLVRAGNTRTDSAHNRYHIAPTELIRIQREGRAAGLDIVGFYHSHPDHPAQWSPTDFAEAHWLGCSYVITAVEQGRAAATHSFHLEGASEDDKRFVHEPIEVARLSTISPRPPARDVSSGPEPLCRLLPASLNHPPESATLSPAPLPQTRRTARPLRPAAPAARPHTSSYPQSSTEETHAGKYPHAIARLYRPAGHGLG